MVVASGPRRLSPIEEIDAYDMRQDFRLFAQGAWKVIEPGKKYVPGWHLDAIAEHLQAVAVCLIRYEPGYS